VRTLTNRWKGAALCLLAVVALSGTWTQREARAATPPNIVLILTDDQRWDSLGEMPVTNARSWRRYTNSYVDDPMCCPSRASTLTGRLPNHTANPAQAAAIATTTRAAVVPGVFNAAVGWFPATPASSPVTDKVTIPRR